MKFDPECKKKNSCDECESRCIHNISFLYGLDERQRHEILDRSVHKSLKRGEYIFREGEAVDYVIFIKKGHVKLNSYDADGRERIIGIFADHDTIWEGIFAENGRYPYSAVCLEKTSVCMVARRDVEAAVSNPAVSLKVIDMLSKKLHDANERNMILSVSEPMARIAAFLVYREKRSLEPIITLRLDDIAGSVGLRPETVSRYIRRMVREGYIEKIGQSGIKIIDAAGLAALVEE